MSDFYINPLSVNEQCHSTNDVLSLIKSMTACFEYLNPAIQKQRIKLWFDPIIENRQFIIGEHFLSSIGRLPNDEDDVKKLWFIYTRKAEETCPSQTLVKLTSQYCSNVIVEGFISDDNVIKKSKWLSFEGHPLNETIEYDVLQDGFVSYSVKNAYHLDSLKPLLPRYEANEKHRKESYYDHGRGEQVAAMPLNHEEAQNLLLISIKQNDDRFAYDDKATKSFYTFKPTHLELEIYHGFQISENDIPPNIKKALQS